MRNKLIDLRTIKKLDSIKIIFLVHFRIQQTISTCIITNLDHRYGIVESYMVPESIGV